MATDRSTPEEETPTGAVRRGPRTFVGPATLAYLLYRIAGALLAPLWFGFLSLPRLRLPWRQRLGGLPRGAPASSAGAAEETGADVWAHAASAGDVRAMVPVLEAIRTARSTWRLVLTVQTRSGKDTALALVPRGVVVTALPIDAWPFADRFVRRLRPRVLVLEYLELWPSVFELVRRHGGHTALVNARLHPRRRRAYGSWLGVLHRAMLARLELCSARSEGDAEAARRLGAPADLVHIHTKHAGLNAPDGSVVAALGAKLGLSAAQRRIVWVAGSAHRDEAAVLMAAHAQVRAELGEARLLLCPRYAEHGAFFARQAARAGLSVRRVGDGYAVGPEHASVLVLETYGELRTAYALGAVAVVGGTFGGRGGQNPLEPAVAGAALVVGPHTVQIETELGWLDPDAWRSVSAADLGHGVLAALRCGPTQPPEQAQFLSHLASSAAQQIGDRIIAIVESAASAAAVDSQQAGTERSTGP